VVAADVYAIPPHTGRGGWSWYTGSAGLTYRLIMESLLGLKREGNCLRIIPCMPSEWDHYSINYRFGRATYRIKVMQIPAESVTNKDAQAKLNHVALDGAIQADQCITLVDDGKEHWVEVCVNAKTYG